MSCSKTFTKDVAERNNRPIVPIVSSDRCPSRIFVVRHGERHDRENPNWARTADRPHDPTLSEQGKRHAFRLGAYLAQRPDIDVRDVVVLSSPLTRCIQTSHELIEGMLSTAETTSPCSPSIVVENSLCEGIHYMFGDMSRNPEAVRSVLAAGYCTTTGRIVAPLFYSPEHHNKFTSSKVQEVQWHIGPTPSYVCDALQNIKEEIRVAERCRAGAHGLFDKTSADDISGKVVICVGHGETTQCWAHGFTGKHLKHPTYTAFVEIAPKSTNDGLTSLHCVTWDPSSSRLVPSGGFATPHLAL